MTGTRLGRAWSAIAPGLLLLACAQGHSLAGGGDGGDGATGGDDGGGGDGGSGATGAGAHGGEGGEAGQGSGASGAGVPTTCGNGTVDAGEDCDGSDLGGKTCTDLGLGPNGSPSCNSFCHFVTSGCLPNEHCTSGADEDGDAAVDCDDDDCDSALACTTACAVAVDMSPFGYVSSSTDGAPALVAPSCTGASGPERIYRFIPPTTASYQVSLSAYDQNLSVSVRTSCTEVTSEVACQDLVDEPFEAENLTFAATAGSEYFVIVDGVSAVGTGTFDLYLGEAPPPETFCDDFFDDDFDGYVDCEDSDCQTASSCPSGPGAAGAACDEHDDCAADANDPVCIDETNAGWPGGYCGQFCAAGTCPSGSSCVDLSLYQTAVCLDDCDTAADCRPGYGCLDMGGSTKVCIHF